MPTFETSSDLRDTQCVVGRRLMGTQTLLDSIARPQVSVQALYIDGNTFSRSTG